MRVVDVAGGQVGDHRSCAVNLLETLRDRGITPVTVPQPLNVFMDGRPAPGVQRRRARRR